MNWMNGSRLSRAAGAASDHAIALRLARDGAFVAVADLDTDNASKVCDEIRDRGGKAIPLQVNVTLHAQVDKMVADTVAHFGRLDILVK